MPVLAIACVSAIVMSRERVVAAADARLVDGGLALAQGDTARVQEIATHIASSRAPVRAQLSDALFLLQATTSATPSRRPALIAAALRRVDAALARRPRWGEALAARAYLEAATPGDAAGPAAMAAFADSYAAAPFLPTAAEWRVRFGATRWAQLSPGNRRSVLNEALWLATVDGGKRSEVFGWFRDTLAYRPLMLRWRGMRHDVWSRGV